MKLFELQFRKIQKQTDQSCSAILSIRRKIEGNIESAKSTHVYQDEMMPKYLMFDLALNITKEQGRKTISDHYCHVCKIHICAIHL